MLQLIINFAIAILIGALVGIDREKKKREESSGVSMAGIRTFILFAALGAASAWLSTELDAIWIFICAFLSVSLLLVAAYIIQNRIHPDLGLTTEIAALIVFFLGGIALFGYRELAVALGIAVSAVLAYKQPIHGLVSKLARDDIYAGLKLLTATFIVLPVLPNRAIDPWGAINPYKTWLLAILISFLSLVGYVFTRWLGKNRGALFTGLFGGLVSSTAVTLSFSKDSHDKSRGPDAWSGLAAGLMLAWTVMFARILVEVLIVNRTIISELLIPMITMGLIAASLAYVLYRQGKTPKAETKGTEVKLQNPFRLTSAVKFALVFTIVLLAVKFVEQNFSGQGYYVVAALAGLSDVDAITLSMADFAKRGGDSRIVVTSIVIAAISNSLVKCGLVVVLGSGLFRKWIAIATAIVLAGGIIALIVAENL
jgi:uncharacterized membrane protein (DUF4010 family)